MKRQILLAGLLALTTVTAPALSWQKEKVEDLPKFLKVATGFYRGGQPTEHGLQALKVRGIKTIVSFRHSRSVIAWEKKQAEALGITFISLPMDGLHEPTDAFINRFLSIVTDRDLQPVFVHCQYGVDRTGTMVALYREAIEDWSAKAAYNEMVKIGFNKNYAWLADSVFDYEEEKKGIIAKNRPASVRLYDSFESALLRERSPRKRVAQVSETPPSNALAEE